MGFVYHSMKKQVSLGWQCLATIFLPTGLYAFKRISKLKLGIIVYVSAYSLTILGGIIQASSAYPWGIGVLEASIGSFVFYISAILIPIYFMRKWTIEWNRSINNVSSIGKV